MQLHVVKTGKINSPKDVEAGSMSGAMRNYLRYFVIGDRNLLLSGSTRLLEYCHTKKRGDQENYQEGCEQ